jgi:uncharacterized protein (DUF1501 family)
MMFASRLRAFDLAEEPKSIQAAYGETDFGMGCLLARRLVEAGVGLIEVALDGWDTHKDNFDRTRTLMSTLDPAMASLIRELADRDLLRSTLVVWMGEFGRTPGINGNEGRDHYPQAFSAVLAGAGLRAGIVHGTTDEDGAKVVDGQVSVSDFFATLVALLGLDPEKSFRTPGGRPVTIASGSPIRALLA